MDSEHHLSAVDERSRYDLHRYDPDDAGYFRFVAPLLEEVRASARPGARGLDFGAGRVPLLARHLTDLGYAVAIYDALYWPNDADLDTTYDFVTACEVVEHFYRPAFEFARLRRLLSPGAPLMIMTDVRRDEIDFDSWSYRRDPTHVAFYSARTFRWIATAFGFKTVDITTRVIRLTTPGG